jgi:glucokinase
VLAVDLGGTKALLGLFAADDESGAAPRALHERRLACADFSGFEQLLAAYLEIARSESALGGIRSVCIGLAGPVDGPRARLTNRPWEIDAARIGAMLEGARVALVNDFVAAAAGIEALGDADLRVVQQAPPRSGSPRLVLGAGTGLGTALLVPGERGWRVLAGEGGHAGFAPGDEQQIGLWHHLAGSHGRVAWEHVVSGPGIEAIYAYLVAPGGAPGSATPASVRVSSARISAAALASDGLRERAGEARDDAHEVHDDAHDDAHDGAAAADPAVACAALDMFASAFGAFAGDAALLALPRGGVYLAGGVAPKVIDARRTRLFLESFRAKGVQSELMRAFPVFLVLEPRLGMLGAALLARRGERDFAPD